MADIDAEIISRARLEKANRLVRVLTPGILTGDDIRLLVSVDAPVLGDVVSCAGVRVPSAATWELVAVLLDERRRIGTALAARAAEIGADPFGAFGEG